MDSKVFEEWLRDQARKSGERAKQSTLKQTSLYYWEGRAEAFLIAADVLKSGTLPVLIDS